MNSIDSAFAPRATCASAPRTVAPSGTREPASGVAALRTALVLGSLLAAAVAWVAGSGAGQAAEPELAMLLRGMAAIKGLLALAAAAVAWWRLGRLVSVRTAVACIACTCLLWAGTLLIWQLAWIPTAAALYHAGAFVGLVIAMREGRWTPRFGRQAPADSSNERVA